MKGSESYVLVSLAWLQADDLGYHDTFSTYLKDVLCLLQEDQTLLVALPLYVVVGSIDQFIENYRDLLLVYFDLLVVVLVEGIALLWQISIWSSSLIAAAVPRLLIVVVIRISIIVSSISYDVTFT